MASTRNINTACNYNIERKRDTDASQYTGLTAYSRTSIPCRAGNGLLTGRMHHDDIDANGIDVESFLYGIRATDMTAPSHTAAPDAKPLPWLGLCPTRGAPIMPKPVNVTGDERYAPS